MPSLEVIGSQINYFTKTGFSHFSCPFFKGFSRTFQGQNEDFPGQQFVVKNALGG